MRILIAASIYPPDSGGPAIHAERQYRWFNQNGVKARVSALAHYRKLPKFIRHWVYLAVLLFKSLDTSLVYAHDAVGSGLPAAIVSNLLKKKLVIRIGGDLAWERQVGGPKLPLAEWYESGAHKDNRFYKLSLWPMKKADKIIVPSVILSDIYTKYYGIEKDKIEVIVNPIPGLARVDVQTEQKVIFASRLVSYKNLEIVLKAFSQIFPTYPELKFLVLGDGPGRKKLEDLSKELNIGNQVVFKGQVSQEEVLRETASCLFTIAPALTEFNPNYVLQGIAYRKPFLVTRGNGFPFVAPENLSFKYDDEKELISSLANLLTPEGYKEAQDFIQSLDLKMNWEDNLKANLGVINGLLNGSK